MDVRDFIPRRMIGTGAVLAVAVASSWCATPERKPQSAAEMAKPPTVIEGFIIKRAHPIEKAQSLPGKNEYYILKTKEDLHIPLNPSIGLMFPNLNAFLYRLVRVRGSYRSYPGGEFTVREIAPIHDDTKSVP